MYRKVFYDDEDIIGYSDDIIEDIIENTPADELAENEVLQELIEQLKKFDWDLVVCHYHPMGAYFVRRLVEENDNG